SFGHKRVTPRPGCRLPFCSDCSKIGCPRSAGIDRRHRLNLTSGTFLEPLLTTKQVRPVQNPPGFSESLSRILFYSKIERMFDFV
ncbi:hypothetical protein MR475_09860, partial [bacterium]|nr:hypothetical protein [bacterium]